MIHRRTFITGLAGAFAALQAPAIILPRSSGSILMPVRRPKFGIPFSLEQPHTISPGTILHVQLAVEAGGQRVVKRYDGIAVAQASTVIGAEDMMDGTLRLIHDHYLLQERLRQQQVERYLDFADHYKFKELK